MTWPPPIVRRPPEPWHPPIVAGRPVSAEQWAKALAAALENVLRGGSHPGRCSGADCVEHFAAAAARCDFARDALLGFAEWRAAQCRT